MEKMLEERIPVKLHTRFKNIVKGKKKVDAIWFKCLDCSGWDRQEADACQTKACILWWVRDLKKERKGDPLTKVAPVLS